MGKKKLYLWVWSSVAIFFGLLLVLIFAVAGTWSFSYGWGFWFAFCIPIFFITAYFLKVDPTLIERRMMPVETRPRQVIGQSIAMLFFCSLIVVPSVCYRFGYINLPFTVSIIADFCIIGGFVIVFKVFSVNTFASRAVEIMENQRVICTGIYSKIRHPMYAGASLIMIAIPIALGSVIDFFLALPLIGIIVLRILDEEKLLMNELEGYQKYCKETKYRLIPYIW